MHIGNQILQVVAPLGRRLAHVFLFFFASSAALMYGFLLPGLIDVEPAELRDQATLAAVVALLMLGHTWWSIFRRGVSQIADRWLGASLLCMAIVPTARWVNFGDPEAEFRLFMRILAASVAMGWILVTLWQRYKESQMRREMVQ